jgi:hypothetical protein
MLVGEQPGDAEDREGEPFVARCHLIARALRDHVTAVPNRSGPPFAIQCNGGYVVITLLVVLLVLMLLGSVPAWPYSRDWGYAPSGTLTLIVIILVVLMASGRF